MKLVLGFGSGAGYYPYTQKPADYQPYRPIYLYRGPPPDAGFSYGLFEDEVSQQSYYADLGLDPFSPFSGKPSKLVREVSFEEMQRFLGDEISKELEECECPFCGADYVQNFGKHIKREELFCHLCGNKIKIKNK